MADYLKSMIGNKMTGGYKLGDSSASSAERNPIVSCCCGFTMILVSMILLGWAEKGYADRVGELDIIKDEVVEISDFDAITGVNKLIHLSAGPATATKPTIKDPLTGFSPATTNYIVFERNVEVVSNTNAHGQATKAMWTRTTAGDLPSTPLVKASTVKIGKYAFSDNLMNKFKEETALQTYPWKKNDTDAAIVKLGASKWIERMGYVCYPQSTVKAGLTAPDLSAACNAATNETVGTRRFNYEGIASPQIVSIMASVDSSGNLKAWKGEFNTFERIQPGSVTAEQFIANAQAEAKTLLWIIRIITFILMIVGFRTVFDIIDWMADWLDYIPVIGECLEDSISCMLTVIAIFMGTTLWLIVWVIAWIVVRPMFAMIAAPFVLLLCGCCCYMKRAKDSDDEGGGRKRGRSRKRKSYSSSRSRSSDDSRSEGSRRSRRKKRSRSRSSSRSRSRSRSRSSRSDSSRSRRSRSS